MGWVYQTETRSRPSWDSCPMHRHKAINSCHSDTVSWISIKPATKIRSHKHQLVQQLSIVRTPSLCHSSPQRKNNWSYFHQQNFEEKKQGVQVASRNGLTKLERHSTRKIYWQSCHDASGQPSTPTRDQHATWAHTDGRTDATWSGETCIEEAGPKQLHEDSADSSIWAEP